MSGVRVPAGAPNQEPMKILLFIGFCFIYGTIMPFLFTILQNSLSRSTAENNKKQAIINAKLLTNLLTEILRYPTPLYPAHSTSSAASARGIRKPTAAASSVSLAVWVALSPSRWNPSSPCHRSQASPRSARLEIVCLFGSASPGFGTARLPGGSVPARGNLQLVTCRSHALSLRHALYRIHTLWGAGLGSARSVSSTPVAPVISQAQASLP